MDSHGWPVAKYSDDAEQQLYNERNVTSDGMRHPPGSDDCRWGGITVTVVRAVRYAKQYVPGGNTGAAGAEPTHPEVPEDAVQHGAGGEEAAGC